MATRPTTSSTVVELLDRAGASLQHASHADVTADRYVHAHLGALRAAAAVLAARSTPSGWSRPRSVWEVLPTLAPELSEWATFFSASASRRALLERGEATVSARQADDLLRQVELFVELVQETLGVPQIVALPGYLSPVSRGGSARHTHSAAG